MSIINCMVAFLLAIFTVFEFISAFKDCDSFFVKLDEKHNRKLKLKNVIFVVVLIILVFVYNVAKIRSENEVKVNNNNYFENTVSNSYNELFIEKEADTFELTNNVFENNTENTVADGKEKYIYESDYINENNTIVDEYTGLIIGVSIGFSDARVQITTPSDASSYSKYMYAGDSIEFEYENKKFQFVLYALDFEAKKYKILIKEK